VIVATQICSGDVVSKITPNHQHSRHTGATGARNEKLGAKFYLFVYLYHGERQGHHNS
jgi:hypothetical protein